MQLSSIWGSSGVPQGAQDDPKSDPKRIPNAGLIGYQDEKDESSWLSRFILVTKIFKMKPKVLIFSLYFHYIFSVFPSFCYIFLGFFILVTLSSPWSSKSKLKHVRRMDRPSGVSVLWRWTCMPPGGPTWGVWGVQSSTKIPGV